MGLAGFNRARRRLAEEHKKRIEAQKVIKKPAKKDRIIKVTEKTDVEEACKELEGQTGEIKTGMEIENLTDITEETKEILKTGKSKKKSKKE